MNTDELKLLWKGGEGVNIVQKYSTFAVSKMGVKSWSTTEIGIDGKNYKSISLGVILFLCGFVCDKYI